ncbi:MAG TPA: mitofilin family membrane protein [Caulobacteraceae bacterium]|jgi:hypothetical protein
MNPLFFACISVLLLLVVAGIVIAKFGPRIWPEKPKPHAAAAAAAQVVDPNSPAALQARIAELQQELDAARRAQATAAGPALQTASADALNQRLDRLEAYERRAGRAASAAVAAGALADAAQTSRPFPGELASLERLMPDSSLVAGLRPLAETGAPTRAALAAEFPDVAARAARAAHAPKPNASFLARAFAAFGALITVRRVDDFTGNSPDSVLTRAERRIDDGDIEGALDQLRTLPPAALAATADWRERAQRRVDIETRIAILRTAALRDLADDAPPPEQGARP